MKTKLFISISKGQIDALEHFIFCSVAKEETKKACIALIKESKGLTEPVYLKDEKGIVYHQMNELGPTLFNQLMKMIGTNFRFHHYDGDIVSFSPKFYDKSALKISKKEISSIKLITTAPLLAG
jgi:hypothetical protein